jgi:hypothetical protein
MMLALLLIVVGYLVATRVINETTLLERVAYTLLFAITVIPFIAMNASIAGSIYPTKTMLAASGLIIVAALGRHAYKHFRAFTRPQFSKMDAAALGLCVASAVAAWFYYTNAEFLLSLASYIQKGEAKCFYMQTFSLVKTLNPLLASPDILKMYGTIATPGNTMFTAPLMPIFGAQTFHVLYCAFIADGFLFIFLLLRRWTKSDAAALAGAFFAVVNPYVLSVEVLDRNLMSFALAAALIYTAFREPEKGWLHGFLWGICAGVGLRFLHITLIAPVALMYFFGKAPRRRYAFLLTGFALTFAFNLPHMRDHGFHSLGEQTPFFELLLGAFTQGTRTPLLPFPNAVGYILHILNYIGLIAAAVAILGAVDLFRRDKKRFAVLILITLPIYLVLAAQRDWIEADKFRIFLMAFLPVILCIGVGLASVFDKSKLRFTAVAFLIAFVLCAGSGFLLKEIEGKPDLGLYERKPAYQSESEAYLDLYRSHLASIGLLPNYKRLFLKLDLRQKRLTERAIADNFFGANGAMSQHPFAMDWFGDIEKPADAIFSDDFVTISIDFEKLVADPGAAVRIDPTQKELLADLSAPKNLLDIYYKEMDVSWQPEKLPITLLTGKPEYRTQKILELEVNAFKSFGADEYGFAKVNMINSWVMTGQRAHAFKTGMTALPQTDDSTVISLRIPRDVRVLIRYWIINTGNGTPWRVDSWDVTIKDGKPKTEFHIMEPESYL